MLVCKECGESFFEEDVEERSEDVGFCGSRRVYQTVWACPVCGSDDIAEAKQCSVCGEWKDEDEVEEEVCDDCRIRIRMEFDRALPEIFTPEQIRALRLMVEERGTL